MPRVMRWYGNKVCTGRVGQWSSLRTAPKVVASLLALALLLPLAYPASAETHGERTGVALDCEGDLESITVRNRGSHAFTIVAVAPAAENEEIDAALRHAFVRRDRVEPGGEISYYSGSGAAGDGVRLTRRSLFPDGGVADRVVAVLRVEGPSGPFNVGLGCPTEPDESGRRLGGWIGFEVLPKAEGVLAGESTITAVVHDDARQQVKLPNTGGGGMGGGAGSGRLFAPLPFLLLAIFAVRTVLRRRQAGPPSGRSG